MSEKSLETILKWMEGKPPDMVARLIARMLEQLGEAQTALANAKGTLQDADDKLDDGMRADKRAIDMLVKFIVGWSGEIIAETDDVDDLRRFLRDMRASLWRMLEEDVGCMEGTTQEDMLETMERARYGITLCL
jgi:hypothetical protein